jgi:hypothetical protein
MLSRTRRSAGVIAAVVPADGAGVSERLDPAQAPMNRRSGSGQVRSMKCPDLKKNHGYRLHYPGHRWRVSAILSSIIVSHGCSLTDARSCVSTGRYRPHALWWVPRSAQEPLRSDDHPGRAPRKPSSARAASTVPFSTSPQRLIRKLRQLRCRKAGKGCFGGYRL